MKIALIGYGKMGQEIERLTHGDSKYKITSVSFGNNKNLDLLGISKADIAIDFTSPEIVIDTIKKVSKLRVNMVIGTSGWYEHIKEIEKIVQNNKIGLIYGNNFSVGVNIFFNIISYASEMFNKYEQYDIYGNEVHHVNKKDSPSGTAKKLSDIILSGIDRKKLLQTGILNRQINNDELHFTSIRAGQNPGKHTITFDSLTDEITLSHQAHNRKGFAEGALVAADYILGKKGLYQFEELFMRGGKNI